jgi:hypothetical protein
MMNSQDTHEDSVDVAAYPFDIETVVLGVLLLEHQDKTIFQTSRSGYSTRKLSIPDDLKI